MMKHLLFKCLLCVAVCLVGGGVVGGVGSVFAQDWQTAAGDAARTRAVEGELGGVLLTPIWRIPTFGLPDSVWVGDVDGDPETEVVLTVGGRARAFGVDGDVEWLSNPADLGGVLAVADLNDDGQYEIVFWRKTAGFAVLRGRDGKFLYGSSQADLATLGSVMLRDVDGDGLTELLATEIDAGGASRLVGRSIIYKFEDLTAPTEVARLQEGTRDYNNGRSLVFADVDGDGAPEVVAIGNTFAYVYSPLTGQMLHRSLDLGSVPYGVSSVFAADIDGDGDDEVLMATNNPYAPAINSRRLTLLDLNGSGVLAPVWTATVSNVGADLHAWPGQGPLVDLDGDGLPEVVHSFYDSATVSWSTFVRDARTGDILDMIPGRLAGVAPLSGVPHVLVTAAPNGPMQSFAWTPTALTQGPELPGDTLMYRTLTTRLPSGHAASVPFVDEADGSVFTVSRLTATGSAHPNPTLWRVTPSGPATAYGYTPGDFLVVDTQATATTIAHMTPSGILSARGLDFSLQSPPPDSLKAIRSPTANLTEPLLLAFDPVTQSLNAGRTQTLFDADLANLATPAESRPILHYLLAATDLDGDTQPDWLGLDTAGITERPDVLAFRHDGSPLWSRDGVVTSQQTRTVIYNRPNLSPDLNGDGLPEILLQTSVASEDRLYLDLISGADGTSLWPSPISATPFASGGTAWPLTLLGPSPKIAFMRVGFFTLHDTANGAQLAITPGRAIYGSLAVDLNSDGAQEVVGGAQIFGRWYAIAQTAAVLWQQLTISTANANARYTGSGTSFVSSPQGSFLVEGRVARLALDHNFVVLDAASGAILHKLNLGGGQIALSTPGVSAARSIGAGVGLSGDNAQYIVSDDQGFIYILDLEAPTNSPDYPQNMLLSVIPTGAPADNISVADIDGDGFVEVAVPTGDGYILILDTPDEAIALDVVDSTCPPNALNPDIDISDTTDRFCGAWVARGAPQDGYVVELVDAESGARVAGPTPTIDPEIQFDGLNLAVGNRYALRVQGYSGIGSSARATLPFESDGVSIVDLLIPPEISLTVSPDEIIPGAQESEIHWVISDASPLSSYHFTIMDAFGDIVFEDGSNLNTTEIDISFSWDGLDSGGQPLPLGVYTVTVEANDFSGLSSVETATIELILPPLEEDVFVDLGGEEDAPDIFEEPDTTQEEEVSDAPEEVLEDIADAAEVEDILSSDDGSEDTRIDAAEVEDILDIEDIDGTADTQNPSEDTQAHGDAVAGEDTVVVADTLDPWAGVDTAQPTGEALVPTSRGEERVPEDCGCAQVRRQPSGSGLGLGLGGAFGVGFGLWGALAGLRLRRRSRAAPGQPE